MKSILLPQVYYVDDETYAEMMKPSLVVKIPNPSRRLESPYGSYRPDVVLRVLLQKEGDAWVFQVIEHDIVAQGETIEMAQEALAETVRAEISYDIERGLKPLQRIAPAPLALAERFERGHCVEGTTWSIFRDRLSNRELSVDCLEVRIA